MFGRRGMDVLALCETKIDIITYLGSVIAANGGVEADVRHRLNERC